MRMDYMAEKTCSEELWNSSVLMGHGSTATEDGKLRVELNQKTQEWEAVLVWVSPELVSFESWRLVEQRLSVSEAASLVGPLAGVFLEEA